MAWQASRFVTRASETGAGGEVTRRRGARGAAARQWCQAKAARHALLRDSQGWMQRSRRQQLCASHVRSACSKRTQRRTRQPQLNASVLRAASYMLHYYFWNSFCGLVCGISAQRRRRVTQGEVLVGAKAKTAVLRRRGGQKQHIPRLSSTKQRCSPPSRKQRHN